MYNGVVKPCILVQSFSSTDILGISGYGAGGSGGVVVTISPTTTNIYSNYRVVMHEFGHVWYRSHKPISDTTIVYMNVSNVQNAITYGSLDYLLIAQDIVNESDGWSGGPCEMDGTLPLELLTFQPSIFSRAAIQLQWQTANEVGTDPMLLYRSRDGVEWEMIFATNSKGNREGSYYTYLDENLSDGIYYYKLETNGKSWIRTVKLGSVVAPVALYPNPTDGIVHLSEPQSTLSLYNPIGQLIANYETTNEIDLSQLPKGIYYLELENGERKMVVKK
ncbi:MAG: T9SS type A sorting domain-containing protein [Saprospiraceae bacterium]|nr:T9SS type A sorting domain-containing protein [Saprospiraceae bacterium]